MSSLIWPLFVLVLPLSLVPTLPAQEMSSAPVHTSSSAAQPGVLPAPVTLNPKHNDPVFNLSAGFTYLRTDLTNEAGRSTDYSVGWYGIPQYNFTRHLGVLADFTNFYNLHASGRENLHGMTAGPVFMLPLGRHWTPFVFAEGGAVRDSKPLQEPDWDAAAVGGIGVNYKVSRLVSLQLIPGEYVATDVTGPYANYWQHNFNAKAGVTFNFYGNR